MSTPEPRGFAEQWISNWNTRNVEAVLAGYADEVIFTSPTATRVVPQTGGTVRGKDALRRYWTLALSGNRDLHFELLGVYAGVDTLALHYRNQRGGFVVEVLTFEGGLVTVGHATHFQTNVAGSSVPSGQRVAIAERVIEAASAEIFELIADPSAQPGWDGNDNLREAPSGQRVRVAGDVFITTLTRGSVRENHVVEFEEGRRIAWRPAEPGKPPPGHLWRWELIPLSPTRTTVRHTYDWSQLVDPGRLARARATTSERLQVSIERLAHIAEATPPQHQAPPP